jgi:hypothetical protein
MKTISFHLILLCFCLLTFNIGCEKAELQTSTASDPKGVNWRGPCDNCTSMNNCCSAITLTGSLNTNHEFSICGTVDGDAVTCEIDPTDCTYPIDGLQHSYFVLNTSGTTIHIFCVAPNTGFSIAHLNSGTATIVLTCQYV